MLVNGSNLTTLFTGFKGAFNTGFEGAPSAYKKIAMTVPSSTREEQYGWLGQFPKMREWIGSRIIWNLSASNFTIKNLDFELTVEVSRNDIEDDRYGIYAPLFQELGRSAAEKPDELIFHLLSNGFSEVCYDGQYFFDTDHPVTVDNVATSKSNMIAGGSEPWFLLDTTKAFKPLVYQERKPLNNIVSKDKMTDDNVFWNKTFIYGTDGRCNAGYGLWQLAYGIKDTLTAANYKTARAAMMNQVGDSNRPLNITPNLLICGPNNESAARKLLNSEYAAGGETNEWKGSAELLVTQWATAA